MTGATACMTCEEALVAGAAACMAYTRVLLAGAAACMTCVGGGVAPLGAAQVGAHGA